MNARADRPGRHVDIGDQQIFVTELGSGPPLVMLHGAGPGVSGWANFAANARQLCASFRTIVLDLPGFGLSGLREFAEDYFTYAASVVARVLDELGVERAHVLGNSLGGGVAARLALDAPHRVDRLVLMGPGGITAHLFAPEPTLGHLRLAEFYAPGGGTRALLGAFMRSMVHDPDLVTEEMIDERYEASQVDGADAGFRAMAQSFARPENRDAFELWRHADRIAHPTLLIWGREDAVNPFDGGLFGFSRMPNARLHVFAGCGHWAQVERADEFNRLVGAFLA